MAYRYFRRNGTKYNATKCVVDGITFDSKHEANRYCELRLLQKGGAISDLQLQVEFVLIPNQYVTEKRYGKNGQPLKDKQVLLERKCSYIADFCYIDNATGEQVVEDTKSPITRTPEYIIKRKLMLFRYGIRIIEL